MRIWYALKRRSDDYCLPERNHYLYGSAVTAVEQQFLLLCLCLCLIPDIWYRYLIYDTEGRHCKWLSNACSLKSIQSSVYLAQNMTYPTVSGVSAKKWKPKLTDLFSIVGIHKKVKNTFRNFYASIITKGHFVLLYLPVFCQAIYTLIILTQYCHHLPIKICWV